MFVLPLRSSPESPGLFLFVCFLQCTILRHEKKNLWHGNCNHASWNYFQLIHAYFTLFTTNPLNPLFSKIKQDFPNQPHNTTSSQLTCCCFSEAVTLCVQLQLTSEIWVTRPLIPVAPRARLCSVADYTLQQPWEALPQERTCLLIHLHLPNSRDCVWMGATLGGIPEQ